MWSLKAESPRELAHLILSDALVREASKAGCLSTRYLGGLCPELTTNWEDDCVRSASGVTERGPHVRQTGQQMPRCQEQRFRSRAVLPGSGWPSGESFAASNSSVTVMLALSQQRSHYAEPFRIERLPANGLACPAVPNRLRCLDHLPYDASRRVPTNPRCLRLAEQTRVLASNPPWHSTIGRGAQV